MVLPTHARWGLVGAGVALVGTSYGLARYAYGLFLPELDATFDLGPTLSGTIGAGSYVGYCGAILVSLLLTPRWGPRRVAVLAGVLATAGMAVVAAAPSAAVLAAGVLLAGSSTGVASPPLAAAVAAWVHAGVRDRAQTVVNAGTGLGVVVSGPVALVVADEWRWAWAGFAVVAAAVTCWVAVAVPAGVPEVADGGSGPRVVPGTVRLVVASFLGGAASVAVWGFGRELLTDVGGASAAGSALAWTVLGAAGVLGALGGDLVRRLGLATSWSALVLAVGGATALLAGAAGSRVVVLAAAAVFGASFVALSGVALLWGARLHPVRTSFGVGVAFVALAAGQAVGSPLVGRLVETVGLRSAFLAWAVVAVLAAAVRPHAGRAVGSDRELTVAPR
ncbi:YbfB/YjiJ family MFS transporter [Rhodococcus aerolatus]